MIRLSLAPPSDLMPPASLTIAPASLAAATQPTPICAMLPVVGYSAPILTGSAAQPRSGPAPKEPAARIPPVFRRKSRRPCRFDRIRLDPIPFGAADGWRSLFMPSPPDAMRRRFPSALTVRFVCSVGIVARLNIVYNIVFKIIITIGDFSFWPAGCAGRGASFPNRERVIQIGKTMVGKSPKRAIARTANPRQVAAPPAREPAAVTIAKRIEEDIVLGRRQPRERLV